MTPTQIRYTKAKYRENPDLGGMLSSHLEIYATGMDSIHDELFEEIERRYNCHKELVSALELAREQEEEEHARYEAHEEIVQAIAYVCKLWGKPFSPMQEESLRAALKNTKANEGTA